MSTSVSTSISPPTSTPSSANTSPATSNSLSSTKSPPTTTPPSPTPTTTHQPKTASTTPTPKTYLELEAEQQAAYATKHKREIINHVTRAWKREKNNQAQSFINRSLSLPNSRSDSPSKQARRATRSSAAATSSAPQPPARCYTISVTESALAAEINNSGSTTLSTTRVLEILNDEAYNPVFYDTDSDSDSDFDNKNEATTTRRILPELTTTQITTLYERFLNGEAYPWAAMEKLISRKCVEKQIDMRSKRDWDNLFEIFEGGLEEGFEVREESVRGMVGEALLWLVAVDRRWGVTGCEKVLRGLEVEGITLVWFDWRYLIRVGERITE